MMVLRTYHKPSSPQYPVLELLETEEVGRCCVTLDESSIKHNETVGGGSRAAIYMLRASEVIPSEGQLLDISAPAQCAGGDAEWIAINASAVLTRLRVCSQLVSSADTNGVNSCSCGNVYITL